MFIEGDSDVNWWGLLFDLSSTWLELLLGMAGLYYDCGVRLFLFMMFLFGLDLGYFVDLGLGLRLYG